MEQELSDSNEQLSEAVVTNQSIFAAKRKMEQEMSTMQAELDEMSHEAAMSEEKAQKAMIEAARLAEELRSEQELAISYERDRKLLEAQLKDLVTRCDEAETNALKVEEGCFFLTDYSDIVVEGRKKGRQQDGEEDQRARVRAGR